MKPLSWDKQLGLASPLKCAANQSGQTNNPSKDKNEVGLDVSHHIHLAPEGRGKYFFLDIPSHRMSENGDFARAGSHSVLSQRWRPGMQRLNFSNCCQHSHRKNSSYCGFAYDVFAFA